MLSCQGEGYTIFHGTIFELKNLVRKKLILVLESNYRYRGLEEDARDPDHLHILELDRVKDEIIRGSRNL